MCQLHDVGILKILFAVAEPENLPARNPVIRINDEVRVAHDGGGKIHIVFSRFVLLTHPLECFTGIIPCYIPRYTLLYNLHSSL